MEWRINEKSFTTISRCRFSYSRWFKIVKKTKQFQNLNYKKNQSLIEWKNLNRFHPQKFFVNQDDLIYCYRRTNAFSKTKFEGNEFNIQFFDSEGSLLNNTEKIENILKNIKFNFIIYVISLVEYQIYDEDNRNKFEISLKLFEKFISFFLKNDSKIPLLLLFNKKDLLIEKLKKFPLRNYFDDFEDQKPIDFLMEKYTKKLNDEIEIEIVSFHDTNDIIKIIQKIDSKIKK